MDGDYHGAVPPGFTSQRSSQPETKEVDSDNQIASHRRLALEAKTMIENREVDSPTPGHSHDWVTTDPGNHRLSIGLFALTSVSFLCMAAYWPYQFTAELHMLRGPFLTVLIVYLFLLNIIGWRIGNVGYVKMFELESDRIVWNTIAGISLQTGVLWSAGAIATLALGILHWNTAISYAPIFLWLALICYFISPFKSYFHDSRMWMVNVIYRILVSPMYHVSFADFWVADQLNSLAIVFLDFEFSFCFLASLGTNTVADIKGSSTCTDPTWLSRQVLGSLPAWWRFAQCLRCYHDTKGIAHLLNAGKYFSTFPMIASSAMLAAVQHQHPNDWKSRPEFAIWFCCTFGRAIYVFVWDVIMDWGFFQRPHNSLRSKHPFLRTHLLFNAHWVYYAMIVTDFILRFIFLIKLSPTLSTLLPSPILVTILATLEVTRRFLWNFFRLEYEQTKGMAAESPAVKIRQHSVSSTLSIHKL